jgi:hypothetical protein
MALTDFSPAVKIAATVAGAILALFIAMKVGQVIIRVIFGLIGLALLAGAAWWLLARH